MTRLNQLRELITMHARFAAAVAAGRSHRSNAVAVVRARRSRLGVPAVGAGAVEPGDGAFAASALAVGALAYFGPAALEHRSTGPASANQSSVVGPLDRTTTPRSLAAVALKHIDIEPDRVGGFRQADGKNAAKTYLIAELDYTIDTTEGAEGVNIMLLVWPVPSDRPDDACAAAKGDSWTDSCTSETLPGGRSLVTSMMRQDIMGGHLTTGYTTGVTVTDGDTVVGVIETTETLRPPPDDIDSWDPPIAVATLRAIALDPGMGRNITSELAEAGEDLSDFNADR